MEGRKQEKRDLLARLNEIKSLESDRLTERSSDSKQIKLKNSAQVEAANKKLDNAIHKCSQLCYTTTLEGKKTSKRKGT